MKTAGKIGLTWKPKKEGAFSRVFCEKIIDVADKNSKTSIYFILFISTNMSHFFSTNGNFTYLFSQNGNIFINRSLWGILRKIDTETNYLYRSHAGGISQNDHKPESYEFWAKVMLPKNSTKNLIDFIILKVSKFPTKMIYPIL